jgi:hypothetical protein
MAANVDSPTVALWQRVLAWSGIVAMFTWWIFPGLMAWGAYREWRLGQRRTPKFVMTVGAI